MRRARKKPKKQRKKSKKRPEKAAEGPTQTVQLALIPQRIPIKTMVIKRNPGKAAEVADSTGAGGAGKPNT